jgi:hypothetical protein
MTCFFFYLQQIFLEPLPENKLFPQRQRGEAGTVPFSAILII